MAVFEISNPSDHYTLEADDFEAACLACIFLGEGAYGLTEVNGERRMPIFLLGGSDAWWKETFGTDIEAAVIALKKDNAKLESVKACLASVLIGNRSLFQETIALIPEQEREAYRLKWHDKHRSSMNNIGKRAWSMSKELRLK